MTECRPPEGTSDGTVCVLSNGGPCPMFIRREWDAANDAFHSPDPARWYPIWPKLLAAYGWHFHSTATPPEGEG